MFRTKKITWNDVSKRDKVFLYAGNLPTGIIGKRYYCQKEYVGLSIESADHKHILCDITKGYPINSESIDSYQAEDVFEHIAYEKLVDTIDEIYRVLKKGGRFRLSVPDYRCDILIERSIKDTEGNIIFDPLGGGGLDESMNVVGGGHVWFPVYESVLELIKKSKFTQYKFYHYTKADGTFVLDTINYDYGYIQRTPDNDERVNNPRRPMSIVVDLIK